MVKKIKYSLLTTDENSSGETLLMHKDKVIAIIPEDAPAGMADALLDAWNATHAQGINPTVIEHWRTFLKDLIEDPRTLTSRSMTALKLLTDKPV